MPFLRGKNHLQGFGHWIRVRAYLRVPGLLAPYLSPFSAVWEIPACSTVIVWGEVTGNSGGGKKDSRGYMWCDPSNEGNCFQWGHPGHCATWCHVDMPPKICDWIKTEDHTEHSMWVCLHLSPSSSHSRSPHNCSPTHHAALATCSPSLSSPSSCYDSS